MKLLTSAFALLISAAAVEAQPTPQATPTLQTIRERGRDADRDLTWEVSYFQVEGLSDARAQASVNRSLRLMGQAGHRYMRIMLRTWEKPAGWTDDSYVSVGMSVGAFTSLLLSVSQDVSSHFAGAAHPNTNLRTRTFDLQAGEVISRRLFEEGTLPEVARRVDAKLRADPDYTVDGEYVLDTVGPEDIRGVRVEKDGVTFLFPPYTLGAYAVGPVSVKLSFKELEGVLANSAALSSVVLAPSGPGAVGRLHTMPAPNPGPDKPNQGTPKRP